MPLKNQGKRVKDPITADTTNAEVIRLILSSQQKLLGLHRPTSTQVTDERRIFIISLI
jgi:hypothetical protein